MPIRVRKSWPGPLVLLLLIAAGCYYQPEQIGTDREITQTVTAISTAIQQRDPKLLDRSKFQVEDLQTRGKLRPAGAAALLSFIAVARGGDYDLARRKLATFLEGQHNGKS